MAERLQENSLLDWVDGKPYFRTIPVRCESVKIRGRAFQIARLEDAAELLDQPDFAKRFVDEDVAPYGMELWPAALMLAEYLSREDGEDNRNAIEIGCGLGLVSIVATCGGWRVTATDNEPTSLRFTAYNASMNEVHLHAVEPLDWHHPPSDRRYGRVLGADLLYQVVDHAPVLRCIDTLLADDGVALIADPNRGVADRFETSSREHGFDTTVIPTSVELPEGRRTYGRIFRLTWSKTK